MPAVRDQRLHLVDSNVFDRPSPRLVEALELLVRLIHPELFEEDR
jgi:iron complex transport system substrate-binding protein